MIPWYRRQGFWNLPNTITVVRTGFIPVMVWLLWDEPTFLESVVACFTFVVAMLLDVVDGWLARKWNLQSVMGAFLDPLADKLMVITALIMLIPLGWVTVWMVLLLEFREMGITGMRSLAAGEGLMISASSLGKLKTAYQSTAISFLLFHRPFLGIDTHSVGTALLYVSLLASYVSAAEYAWGFYVHYNRKR